MKKTIYDLLEERKRNLQILHTSDFPIPLGFTVSLIRDHNEARRMSYKILKDYDLKCTTLENEPDIVSGHAIIYRENGQYAAIIVDKKESFSKEEIDGLSGLSFLPLHWTERSSKEEKSKKNSVQKYASVNNS